MVASNTVWLMIKYSQLRNNSAYLGGAVYSASANAVLHETKFYSNVAEYKGGAFSTGKIQYFEIQGCDFQNNTAGFEAGALYSSSTTLSITLTVFQGNSAVENAGALYISRSTQLNTLVKCKFIGNYASLGGALYTSSGLRVSFNGVEFSKNSATLGSVIYDSGSTTGKMELIGEKTKFENNVASLSNSEVYSTSGKLYNFTDASSGASLVKICGIPVQFKKQEEATIPEFDVKNLVFAGDQVTVSGTLVDKYGNVIDSDTFTYYQFLLTLGNYVSSSTQVTSIQIMYNSNVKFDVQTSQLVISLKFRYYNVSRVTLYLTSSKLSLVNVPVSSFIISDTCPDLQFMNPTDLICDTEKTNFGLYFLLLVPFGFALLVAIIVFTVSVRLYWRNKKLSMEKKRLNSSCLVKKCTKQKKLLIKVYLK